MTLPLFFFLTIDFRLQSLNWVFVFRVTLILLCQFLIIYTTLWTCSIILRCDISVLIYQVLGRSNFAFGIAIQDIWEYCTPNQTLRYALDIDIPKFEAATIVFFLCLAFASVFFFFCFCHKDNFDPWYFSLLWDIYGKVALAGLSPWTLNPRLVLFSAPHLSLLFPGHSR